MDKLEVLKSYFPNGTAEGERELLKTVFVPPTQMAELMSAPTGSPRILVGNKGVGKTALLERILTANLQQKIPALLLRPDDLDLGKLGNATDIATSKKALFECLVAAISAQIGTKLSGLLTADDAELHRQAVKRGLKAADKIEKTLNLLSTIAKPQTQIDFLQLASSLSGQPSDARLLDALRMHLGGRSSVVALLIDDTDQIASPDDPNHLNRIWGLLLAVRKLANELPNLECIVSLRTEVWLRLQRDEKGQRDQIDHIRPLITDLRVRDEHMANILDARVSAAARQVGAAGNPWEVFFESKEMQLPGSTETRSWRSFLLKSARERPRDAVQLVGKLIDSARTGNRKLISSLDAEQSMHSYSKERVNDLAIEMGRECPNLEEIIRTLAELRFDLSFEELRKHLATVPSRFGVVIRGRTVRPEDEKGAVLAVLGILHEAGVVNARVVDSREPKGFRHINFRDEPNLVSSARWNDLQAVHWEVHPAFRSFLLDIGEARAHGGR